VIAVAVTLIVGVVVIEIAIVQVLGAQIRVQVVVALVLPGRRSPAHCPDPAATPPCTATVSCGCGTSPAAKGMIPVVI